jgi:hypothetical protein
MAMNDKMIMNKQKEFTLRKELCRMKRNKFEGIEIILTYMRAVCKVHGLTLLLQAGTLLRCGDGLFFEVHPLASNALLTMLHPLLENSLQTTDHMLQTVHHFKICLGAPFSWLEKPRNCMGQDLN